MSSHTTTVMFLRRKLENYPQSSNTHLICFPEVLLVVAAVVLVFYGPLTHFRSFRARSVNLATLFLGKPLRQFTST